MSLARRQMKLMLYYKAIVKNEVHRGDQHEELMQCPECIEPLTAELDRHAECFECGWTMDAVRPMDYL